MEKFRKTGEKYFIVDRNEYLPSVTTILNVINKPALIKWGGGQVYDFLIENPGANRKEAVDAIYHKRDKAADVGSTMHSFYEAVGNGARRNTEGLPEALRGYGNAFIGWVNTFKPTFKKTEHTVWSNKHNYAGTVDAIITDQDGKTWLIDFKTSKGIWPEMGIQLSAYKEAVEEMEKIKIDKQAIIQLKSDGTMQMQEFNVPFEVFLGAKELWRYLNGN